MSVVLLVVGLLPASRWKNALLSLLGPGWSVDRAARVHPVVLWRVGRLRVGSGCLIGPANVFRDLTLLELAPDAAFGQFNWVTAEARYAEQADPERAGTVVLDTGAAVNSRHYLDCAGGFRLGRFGIVAGVRCTFLTHWADHRDWVLRAAPIDLGDATIVSSGSTVTAGVTVADRCVVAAGAVVPKSLTEPGKLCGGVPAKPIADLTGAAHAEREAPRFARTARPADPTVGAAPAATPR